jgi:hypothetical protein
MITRTSKRTPVQSVPARRTISAGRTITAGTPITAGVRPRQAKAVAASTNGVKLTPAQQAFANQLRNNCKMISRNITAATNTSNIMAKPDFLELLPLFVQKLIATEVVGSVAMKSRQQLIPYFKFIAENTKGETAKGTVINSPFVNRQGQDPNWTGRTVKNEAVAASTLAYVPVLPGSVTLTVTDASDVTTKYIDNGAGGFVDAATGTTAAITIDYATGFISGAQGTVAATYQYDNETVGPDAAGNYGAKMAKGYLMLDEINLIAEAHEIACYWSIYSAFAANTEYGANIGEMAKEAAVSELTAEINSYVFEELAKVASYKPQFNWDASPVLSGAVVPSDYLNMFKLKLGQAAASIYQATRLTRPNKIVCGTNAAEYIAMIDSFSAAGVEETVGPYKLGTLDQFEVYVDPDYDANTWVMSCKSADIRRNSALFGEYMPIVSTDAIGLANASVQQGHATMYALKVVNPATIVSGKILGTF